MEIQIIHETTLENPESFEEVEIWMDLYLASGKDTYDTPGYTDIQIKDWGVIDENRNLQLQASTSTGPSTPTVVTSQNSTQTKEPPLPATAEQRDSEAIAGYAFTLQKRRARAY